MPDLPTLTLTTKQADRVLAAFKARHGTTTTAETVDAYRAELRQWVTNVVLTYERDALMGEQNRMVEAQLASIRGEAEEGAL